MNRFFNSNESDIDFLREKSDAKNTLRSTGNWLRVYQSWAKIRRLNEQLETYQPSDLDVVLQRFYTEVRKMNGKEYEPDSLKVMMGSLDRHLKSLKYPTSIINGMEFLSSRKVLDEKLRKLLFVEENTTTFWMFLSLLSQPTRRPRGTFSSPKVLLKLDKVG